MLNTLQIIPSQKFTCNAITLLQIVSLLLEGLYQDLKYIPLMLILTFKYILISISLDFLVQFPGGFSLLLILLADNCFCTHALSLVRDLLVVPLPLAHPHSPLPAAAHRLRRPSRGSASARRGRQQPGSVFSVRLRVCVPRALGSSSGQPCDGGTGVRRGDRQWPVEWVRG